jgi:alpha-N-arabinofuranosidase
MVNVLQSMILTKGDQMVLTPTYYVYDFYTVHHDALALPITMNAGEYVLGRDSVPAVSASASRDKQGRVHITMTNRDPNRTRTVRTDIRGMRASQVSGRVLTASTMSAHNTFESPDAIQPQPFNGASVSGSTLTVQLPAKSVVVLEIR